MHSEAYKKLKAKLCGNAVVIDPDSQLPVEIDIYKLESGGMVGIDASFLENDVGPVFSPFDANVELELDDSVEMMDEADWSELGD